MLDLSAAFRLPPKEAVAWFEAKGYRITWDWHEMRDAAHAQAFTVAKAARLDILQDIRGGIEAALKEGRTERQFIRDLTPILQNKGWWGKAHDPETGEVLLDAKGRRIRQGSPRRLSTIYRTNLQSAYMAGRWKAAEAARRTHPYLQYVAVMDGRTRPTHAAMNGRVFAVDDPIWHTHYPPNGYNCRCRTRPMTARALEREGLALSSSAGRISQVERPVILRDPEAGTTRVTVYKGPDMARGFAPDVGFNSNPGRAQALWDKNGRLPDCYGEADFAERLVCLAGAAFAQKTWRDYGRPDLRHIPESDRLPAPELLPRAGSRAQAAAILADTLGVSDSRSMRIVDTPMESVIIDHGWLAHMVEKEIDARERYARYILPTLETPFEVWLTAYADAYRRQYIGLFSGPENLMVVMRENLDGSLMWNVMQANDKNMNKHRMGALLYGR